MCMSSPNIPDPPPPVQEAKAPELGSTLRTRKPVTAGGSLLTSPSGITQSALTTGAPSLLGGV